MLVVLNYELHITKPHEPNELLQRNKECNFIVDDLFPDKTTLLPYSEIDIPSKLWPYNFHCMFSTSYLNYTTSNFMVSFNSHNSN